MKLDLSRVSYDGKFYDFGGGRLKIRPYPATRNEIAFKDGAVIFSGDAGWDMFDYCLEAWEGVTDAEGKELKLTKAIKKQIYDFRLGVATLPDGKETTMADFVLATARARTSEIEEDVKN